MPCHHRKVGRRSFYSAILYARHVEVAAPHSYPAAAAAASAYEVGNRGGNPR